MKQIFLVFNFFLFVNMFSQIRKTDNSYQRRYYSIDTIVFTTVSDLRKAEHYHKLAGENVRGRNVWYFVDTSTIAYADDVILFRYPNNTFVRLSGMHYDCIFKSDTPELYEEYSKRRDWGFKSNGEKAWRPSLNITPITKYKIQKDTIKLLEINRHSGEFETEIEYTREKTKADGLYETVVWFEEEEGIYTLWYVEGPVKRKIIHLYEFLEGTILYETIVDKELGIPLKIVRTFPNAKYITYFSEN